MARHTAFRLSETRQDGQFVIECETNIPDCWNTVATCSYKPFAQLFAAAPDLLEKCRAALSLLEGQGGIKDGPIWTMRKQLRQAIAKAEGSRDAH